MCAHAPSKLKSFSYGLSVMNGSILVTYVEPPRHRLQQQPSSSTTQRIYRETKVTKGKRGKKKSVKTRRKMMVKDEFDLINDLGMSEQALKQTSQAEKGYEDVMFDPWQKQVATHYQNGKHVIVAASTSCGKTWSARRFVADLTLRTDDQTSLFVCPNTETLRETIIALNDDNRKIYQRGGRTVCSQSMRYTDYEDKNPPTQLMCITADNFYRFLTDPLNANWLNRLKSVVFDEIHMNEVSKCMWWFNQSQIDAQIVALSATLGDLEATKRMISSLFTNRQTEIIDYHIRPVPIQRMLYQPSTLNIDHQFGAAPKKRGKDDRTTSESFTYQINLQDPTIRDCQMLEEVLAETAADYSTLSRTEQYQRGQMLVGKLSAEQRRSMSTTVQAQIRAAVHEPSSANLVSLIQQLFLTNRAPVMIFHSSTNEAISCAKALVGTLSRLEAEDPEVKKARAAIKHNRRVDKHQSNLNTAKLDHKLSRAKNAADAALIMGRARVRERQAVVSPDKWRYPNNGAKMDGRGVPGWLSAAVEYGIGVFCKSMKLWQKNRIFDFYRLGKIKVLISDDGLCVGVNLPARSVITCGDIAPTMYLQMGGRCARRGLDTEGYVIPLGTESSVTACLEPFDNTSTVSFPSQPSLIDIISLKTKLNRKLKIPKKLQAADIKQLMTKQLKIDSMPVTKLLATEGWFDSVFGSSLCLLPSDGCLFFFYMIKRGMLNTTTAHNLMKLLCYCHCSRPAKTDKEALEPLSAITEKLAVGWFKQYSLTWHQKIDRYMYQFYLTGEHVPADRGQIKSMTDFLYTCKHIIDICVNRKSGLYKAFNVMDQQFYQHCTYNG